MSGTGSWPHGPVLLNPDACVTKHSITMTTRLDSIAQDVRVDAFVIRFFNLKNDVKRLDLFFFSLKEKRKENVIFFAGIVEKLALNKKYFA